MLFDLLQRQAIGQDDALRFADSPNNLRLRMKRIRQAVGGRAVAINRASPGSEQNPGARAVDGARS